MGAESKTDVHNNKEEIVCKAETMNDVAAPADGTRSVK